MTRKGLSLCVPVAWCSSEKASASLTGEVPREEGLRLPRARGPAHKQMDLLSGLEGERFVRSQPHPLLSPLGLSFRLLRTSMCLQEDRRLTWQNEKFLLNLRGVKFLLKSRPMGGCDASEKRTALHGNQRPLRGPAAFPSGLWPGDPADAEIGAHRPLTRRWVGLNVLGQDGMPRGWGL